jgi:hypothetical protein
VLVNGRPFTSGRVPYNTPVNVTKGNLQLRTDTGTLRVYGSGVPSVFRLIRGTDRGRPIVELRLQGGNFGVCRRTSSASQAPSRRVVRQLWGNGKGRFRTRGNYSSATVRGTFWLTADRCDGTFTRVRQGVIELRNLRLKRTIRLRAGQTYLARRP